jgi:GT2 family glycosyltransferase
MPRRSVMTIKLSIIIATRNRAHALVRCLDSVVAALASAGPLDAEIVIVDNGSTDDTAERAAAWTRACTVPVQLLSEPRPGLSRAHNRAVRAARGELFVFTDDDCKLSQDYISHLLRYDAADTELVLRGGRIELGDATDLPLTINTGSTLVRWSRKENSARREVLSGRINGCNMTMRRALVERVGPFDEDFGAGSRFGSGNDTDYIYRAYLADAILEYVPDMTVFHYHGRKTNAEGNRLFRNYLRGDGALYARYFFKHPNLCRPFYWDCKNAFREIINGTNTFLPAIGFSHKDKVVCCVQGAVKYFFTLRREAPPMVLVSSTGDNDPLANTP